MDLDQLKEVWQNQEQPFSTAGDDKKLAGLLTRQSNSSVTRMKRNLLTELVILVICFGSVAVYYFLAFKGNLAEVAWMYIFLTLVFGYYYYRKNKLLNEMQCSSCHVRSNLERQVSTLEKYVHTYMLAGTYMVPVLLLFLGWIFYLKVPSAVPKNIFFHSPAYPWWQTLSAWVMLAVVLTIPVYFLNRWYIHRLYGRHILRLKKILSDMEETAG